jgi:hypothetical protein
MPSGGGFMGDSPFLTFNIDTHRPRNSTRRRGEYAAPVVALPDGNCFIKFFSNKKRQQ